MTGVLVPSLRLGRVEGIRLLRNPLVWLPLVLTAMWARSYDTTIDAHFILIGYGLVLPAFVMIAVMVLAVTRGRRHGAEELLGTLPVGWDRRTAGHGFSALAGGLLGVVVVVALLAYLRPGPVLGVTEETIPLGVEVPRPNLAQLLQGPAAVVVYCTLGVALARWVPSRLVLVALVVPMAIQFLVVGIWSAAGVNPHNWWWPLSTGMVVGDWVGCGERDPVCALELAGFDRVTPWFHLAYDVALAVLLVAVGVLRSRRDRVTWSVAGAALTAVVALGLTQWAVYEQYEPLVVAAR